MDDVICWDQEAGCGRIPAMATSGEWIVVPVFAGPASDVVRRLLEDGDP